MFKSAEKHTRLRTAFCIVFALFTLILCAAPCAAENEGCFLSDDCNYLTDDEKSKIIAKQEAFYNDLGVSLGIDIEDSLRANSESYYRSCAMELLHQTYGTSTPAIVLVIGIEDHRYYTFTDGGVGYNLSDSTLVDIGENYAKKHLKNEDYYNAIAGFIDGYRTEYQASSGVVHTSTDPTYTAPSVFSDFFGNMAAFCTENFLWVIGVPLVATAIAGFCVYNTYKNKFTPSSTCYVPQNGAKINYRRDDFIREYTVSHRISSDNDGGSSGGGGGGGGGGGSSGGGGTW